MKLMKTSDEMFKYCQSNCTMQEYKLKHRLTDFAMIEDCLEEDEQAIMCFTGAYSETNLKGASTGLSIFVAEEDNLWACAFTNKRFIMAQKCKSPVRLRIIPYSKLTDVFVVISEPNANIIISTVTTDFDIHMDSEQGRNVKRLLNGMLRKIEQKKSSMQAEYSDRYDIAEEIRKFKALCNDGIITEEEFRKRKMSYLDQK